MDKTNNNNNNRIRKRRRQRCRNTNNNRILIPSIVLLIIFSSSFCFTNGFSTNPPSSTKQQQHISQKKELNAIDNDEIATIKTKRLKEQHGSTTRVLPKEEEETTFFEEQSSVPKENQGLLDIVKRVVIDTTSKIATLTTPKVIPEEETVIEKEATQRELLLLMSNTIIKKPTALSITQLTEEILDLERKKTENSGLLLFVLRRLRSSQLDELLRIDRDAYIATATFLSSSIPRSELPNVQDIPHPQSGAVSIPPSPVLQQKEGEPPPLVADCTVPDTPVLENPLEALLLYVTRNIYANITGTERRYDMKGIPGLVEEMRSYMLSTEGSSPKQQQDNLLATLLVLMTPVLPPFYRIFMGWKVPSVDAGDPQWLVDFVQKRLPFFGKEGKSYGPAPYAPLLTSWVAPYVFSFLVGPVRVNLRPDGRYGGIVVAKCKFLQQSNCKGMCLHSCKVPAQNLFDSLGLPLRVSPDFDSQECQWNFGEVAPLPQDDPTWPKGCLVGCGTREAVAEIRKKQREQVGDDNGQQRKKTEVANCY